MLGNWQPYAPPGADAEEVDNTPPRCARSSRRPGAIWRPTASCSARTRRQRHHEPGRRAALRRYRLRRHPRVEPWRAPARPGAGLADVLPAIKAAVGDKLTLLLDSGVRRGADILIALCLGADFSSMGARLSMAPRPAACRRQEAIDIFVNEIDLVMGQIGCPSLDRLGPDFCGRTSGRRTVDRSRGSVGQRTRGLAGRHPAPHFHDRR